MNLIIFVWHYLLAVAYIFVSPEWRVYYVIGVVAYLFFHLAKTRRVNAYRDVHPFFIGFASSFLVALFPDGKEVAVSFAVLLSLYVLIMYGQRRNEEKGLFPQNKVGNAIVYAIILPFSAFMTTFYVWEEETLAFLVYAASLFYGIFRNRLLFANRVIMVFVLLNASLLLLYSFQYVPLLVMEKVAFLLLMFGMALFGRMQLKKQFAGG